MDLRDVCNLDLRPATEADRPAVEALLHTNGLQPLDAGAQFGPQYAVALCDGRVVGVAGVEVHGQDGLLRSVAVEKDYRSLRIGSTLAENRLNWAREQGLHALYLLTDTAAHYWVRLGFHAVGRNEAPEGIEASHEWSSGCPASSTAMRLDL